MCISSTGTKKDYASKILDNREVAPGFFRMEVIFDQAETVFHPGQFFQIKFNPGGLDPLLRRPFAPSETSCDRLAFLYALAGRGTREMATLKAGDSVSLLAPLGRGYTLPEDSSWSALLVGGGCGAPSLLSLARRLVAMGNPVYATVGAQTGNCLLERAKLESTVTLCRPATDDGSVGFKGHAVAAAEEILNELGPKEKIRLFGCGPLPMLRALAGVAAQRNLPCELSLEARMACGFGACVGCVVKVEDRTRPEGFVFRKVCLDGPVFDARTLLW